MDWRLAKCLEKLRSQVNAKWPDRSKDSDGSIGDASHASRSSDHNPWIKDAGGPNVVSAIDITHDPQHGFDSYAFADMLLKNRDPRIKYVISNGRIGSGSDGIDPWVWRKYFGQNKHDHHVHISVKSDKEHYDSVSDWKIDGIAPPSPEVIKSYTKPNPTLRRGDSGEYVKQLQLKLGFTGSDIDGEFGAVTETAVRNFQKVHNTLIDGVVGPQTWKSLG